MTRNDATLRAVKTLHTAVWAWFAGCIVAIPIAAWRGQPRAAARLAVIVLGEVGVLAVNRGHCPLTAMAARYTDDRSDTFDIYLPRPVARYNKLLFGTLYVAGVAYAVTMRARPAST